MNIETASRLDYLHEVDRRLGDAIFCLEEIHAFPEIVGILKMARVAAIEDYDDTENALHDQREKEHRKENIPNSIRWDVFERDNFTCRSCGSRKLLTIDHIIPEIRGGTLDMNNLQTLCKSCNSKKGTK